METKKTCCGWDIGIKTLSYCKLQEINKPEYEYGYETAINKTQNYVFINNKYYNILAWDIINLTFDANPQISNQLSISLTNNLNTKCTDCKCKAKYNYKDLFYCNKHKQDNSLPICKKPKCQEENCDKFAKFMDETNIYFGYCAKHKKGKEISMKPIKKEVKTMSIGLTDIGKTLYTKLNDIENINTTDTILLENQPVLKNPTMKSVQMLLYSYFIINGIMDANPDMYIKCYAANKKNNLINLLEEDERNIIKERIKLIKGNEYAKRKKETIYITEILLNQFHDENMFKIKFKNAKKQDDLADSFLMTLYYLNTNT